MNEREFGELMRKKNRAQKWVRWLSNLQLGGAVVGLLFWVLGFFVFDRQLVWAFFCLVFTAMAFVLRFVERLFHKKIKEIDAKMKPVSGGSGAGRTRYSITPTVLKETEE